MWSRLIDQQRLSEPRSRICAIPEKGGKYRVANVADIGTVSLAQPLGDQVISILKRHPALKGAYTDDHTYCAKRLSDDKTRNVQRRFYSTDMNQSTDTLKKEVVYAVVDGIAEALDWTVRQKERAMRTVRPMNLYDEKEKLLGQNINGTLLGLPLSFAILCLVHLYCVEAMSRNGIRRTVVYGDDMATFATGKDWDLYVQRCNNVGFTLNKSKTHISDYGFTFCGKIYKRFGEHVNWIRASKLSIVTGASGTGKNWEQILSQHAQASHLMPPWQASRIKDKWSRSQYRVAHTFSRNQIPFCGHIENGGLGFKGKLTSKQRKIAIIRGFTDQQRPYGWIWDTRRMAPHIKRAAVQVYKDFDQFHSKVKRVPKGPHVKTDEFLTYLLISGVHMAAASVTNYKFTKESKKGPNNVAKKIRNKSNEIVKLYDENTLLLSLPTSPSARHVSNALNSLKHNERFDVGEVEAILNALPSRHTMDDRVVPNFKLDRYLYNYKNRHTPGRSQRVHMMLRIKQ
jgi:hypothetical protein